MSPALFGHDGMRGELGSQPLDDETLAGPIGRGDQVVLAFELEAHVPLSEITQ
jgi:hypothetical protein